MPFWTYMLQCRGGFLYVGHTDDLARQIAEHSSGKIRGYTRDHLPVTLVWSREFQTRDEAKASEKQVKGWARAKKVALIGGDRERIAELAIKLGSPSTGSGTTEDGGSGREGSGAEAALKLETVGQSRGLDPARPKRVEKLCLLGRHPDTPSLAVTAVRARMTALGEHWLTLRWSVAGAGRVVLPPLAGTRRADGLWRHTCFELFLQSPDSAAYVELNLSPSENWAAYDFTRYREGMAERPMPRQPDCTARIGHDTLIFDAAVPMAGLPPLPWRAGLTAVIEEEGGVMSYWALAHPPGAPDFHHPACLALTVPAPQPR